MTVLEAQDTQANVLSFPDGSSLPYTPDPDRDGSVTPTRLVGEIVEALRGAQVSIEKVRRDATLSDLGRASKAEAIGDELIVQLAKANAALDTMEAGMARTEAQWQQPPALEPGDAVGFMTDQARRDYVMGLPANKKSLVFNEMLQGKHLDLVLALVRSPIPLGDGYEVGVARDVWAHKADSENQHKAASLATGRRSLEWGRRQLAQLTGIATRTTRADARRVERVLKTAGLAKP